MSQFVNGRVFIGYHLHRNVARVLSGPRATYKETQS